jgi:hypothetical protein
LREVTIGRDITILFDTKVDCSIRLEGKESIGNRILGIIDHQSCSITLVIDGEVRIICRISQIEDNAFVVSGGDIITTCIGRLQSYRIG